MSRPDARAKRGEETRTLILDAARDLVAERGVDVRLEDIASRVGLTRQAVLYHFPAKERVLVTLALEAFAAESKHAIAAVGRATGTAALERFVRGLWAFYVEDVERFRLIYLRGQMLGDSLAWFPTEERVQTLYPLTTAMYDAVERGMKKGLGPEVPCRTMAVAGHAAAVGFATMYGATVGRGDPMKRPFDEYLDALIVPWMRGLGLDR